MFGLFEFIWYLVKQFFRLVGKALLWHFSAMGFLAIFVVLWLQFTSVETGSDLARDLENYLFSFYLVSLVCQSYTRRHHWAWQFFFALLGILFTGFFLSAFFF